MADETPRSSTRVTKSSYRKSISSFPESPLGATPRPDLRQHYPAPPPSVDFQSVYSHISTTSVDTGSNDSNFTHLRKKTSAYSQIKEWTLDHSELKPEGSTRKALLILTFIFLTALLALGVVYSRFPLQ